MEIIGRLAEKALFAKILGSAQAEFVAVYGRRRVGKTFLIRNFFSKKGVYFECSGIKDGNLSQQLIHFTKKFSQTFYPTLILQAKKNWQEAFELLTLEIKKLPKTKKVIIFLDELPWLASPRSQLIQNLDYFWNTEWSHLPNCKLIVCGSAAAWMLNNLIHAKGGLYNRITRTILLKPFTLGETKKFLEHKKIKLTDKQIVDLYMIMGGVPFYLNQLEKSKSLIENINAICFEETGLLYTEFPRLFASLFNSSEHHIALVKAMAKKYYGISFSDLAADTANKPGGRLQERLHELEACGFIQKYLPYGRTKRDHYYRITDEYTLFYLTWIHKFVEGAPSPKGANYWLSISQSPKGLSWSGLMFEMVVFKHIDHVIKALKLEKTGCLASHWRYQPSSNSGQEGAQIDLVLDRPDNAITLCEIKYSLHPFVIDKAYAKNLLKKMEIFERQLKQPKQLFLAMITTGLKHNVWSDELVNHSVDIQDLFK